MTPTTVAKTKAERYDYDTTVSLYTHREGERESESEKEKEGQRARRINGVFFLLENELQCFMCALGRLDVDIDVKYSTIQVYFVMQLV